MNAILPFQPVEARVRLPKVVIINDFSVARGGATALALLSARYLKEMGHEVTFISGDQGDAGELEQLGIKTVWLGGRKINEMNKLRAAKDGLFNQSAAQAVSDYIDAYDDDDTIYHMHVWSQILSPSVFDALKRVAHRTFVHAHDFFLTCPNGALFDFREQRPCPLTPSSTACLLKQCDKRAYLHKLWRFSRHSIVRRYFGPSVKWAGVVSLHPDMDALLKRGGMEGQRIVSVRNPAVAFSDERVTAEDNDVFAFMGRIETGKGVDVLCAAARQANVKLRVIGNFTENEDLRRQYPEVEFTGWVDRKDAKAHLKDVRALVMPSQFTEPFGLVAAEGSASGLPVVVSDTAVIAREVGEMGLGLATDVSSADSLAQSLKQMAETPRSKIKAMSETAFNARRTFANTPQDWARGLQKLYLEAVAR